MRLALRSPRAVASSCFGSAGNVDTSMSLEYQSTQPIIIGCVVTPYIGRT